MPIMVMDVGVDAEDKEGLSTQLIGKLYRLGR